MTQYVSFAAMALAAGVAALGYRAGIKQGKRANWLDLYLTAVLPFGVGGFHTYTVAFSCVLMLVELGRILRKHRQLQVRQNVTTAAVLLVAVFGLLTPLWAADRGMALVGTVRYLPPALYVLILTQRSREERQQALAAVPLCGVMMTVAACLMLPIPAMAEYVTEKGRLTGFMQYPNTYAAFLLAGLVLNRRERGRCVPVLMDGVLILGILLSGSQTGFCMLLVALVGLVLLRPNGKQRTVTVLVMAGCLALAVAAAKLGWVPNADRFAAIDLESKSFQLRLLYYRDAMGLILRNPFGLGYMGFRAVEGSIQTGGYSTNFVHNGLLQMLLDLGWLPGLAMAAAFLKGICSRKTDGRSRLLLLVLLGHCMLDFDLQFLAIWVILLAVLDCTEGKERIFRPGKGLTAGLCAAAAAGCLWLGTGELCYRMGNISACLAITPFHTGALTAALTDSADGTEMTHYADRVLAQNRTSSLAYSAKANVALSQGQILDMMTYKEQAIACARYTSSEYADYFYKLYTAAELYLRAGDSASAAVCLEKLMSIPAEMEAANETVSRLGWKTGTQKLELPEAYQEVLESLEQLTAE